jgi:hypothetical protein
LERHIDPQALATAMMAPVPIPHPHASAGPAPKRGNPRGPLTQKPKPIAYLRRRARRRKPVPKYPTRPKKPNAAQAGVTFLFPAPGQYDIRTRHVRTALRKPAKTYKTNSKRECARRRRQAQRISLAAQ